MGAPSNGVFTPEQDNDKTHVEPVHSYDAFHTRSDMYVWCLAHTGEDHFRGIRVREGLSELTELVMIVYYKHLKEDSHDKECVGRGLPDYVDKNKCRLGLMHGRWL